MLKSYETIIKILNCNKYIKNYILKIKYKK